MTLLAQGERRRRRAGKKEGKEREKKRGEEMEIGREEKRGKERKYMCLCSLQIQFKRADVQVFRTAG